MRSKHQKNCLAIIKLRPVLLPTRNSQAGFTIIESLMAIIVVAILLSAIAPVILLSTATRLQARRVELATQAAKAYTDGVSAGSIDAPAETSNIASADVPTAGSMSSCDSGKYCSTTDKKLYCVDGDNDDKCLNTSSKDFIVQAFRTTGDAAKGYALGLRVYRSDAFKDSDAFKAASKGDKKQNTFTGGLGDRKAPLLEMTTDISTQNTTFASFCSRLKDDANTQSKCQNK